MKRCVILASGPVEEPGSLRPLLREGDFYIAADGGLRLAARLGIIPALVVADFDSIGREEAERRGVPVFPLPCEKDDTDTLAAVRIAYEKGFRDFLLLGCTGGRLDHTMAAVCVLEWLLNRGARALLADERNRLELLAPGTHRIEPAPGWKLSLLAYGGPVTGLTERYVKYELTDATLTTEFPVGVSNEFTSEPVEIRFMTGILMVFRSKD
ncbi:MAG: thiamine diphosphokinase [Clostridiales bacterium]|jgi:thiamine pyrophosphokinase|nr:thiamine diphosphokinase [Clostridiales bacterium]